MESIRQLIVNCDICDARKIKEENLKTYEKIMIRADILAVSEQSKEVLERLPVVFNGDSIMEVSEEAEFSVNNGNFEIWPQTAQKKKLVMVVNGNLTVHPQAGECIQEYAQMIVNGNLYCPAQDALSVGRFIVNGKRVFYPGDCVVLAPEFTADRYFALRAGKGTKYFAADKVRLTEPGTDVAKMAEKEIRFVTETLVVPEEKLEDGIRLVDETVKLLVVPEGYAYICGDTQLDGELLSHGNRLYIDGNLEIKPGQETMLERLEAMEVSGELRVPDRMLERVRTSGVRYGKLTVCKGSRIKNRKKVTVDGALLEQSPDGLQIRNCVEVSIDSSVSAGQLEELVEFRNCARVLCSPKQEGAVAKVSRNVGKIGNRKDEEGEESDLMQPLEKSRIVNSDICVL